jgi:hypothetical protein
MLWTREEPRGQTRFQGFPPRPLRWFPLVFPGSGDPGVTRRHHAAHGASASQNLSRLTEAPTSVGKSMNCVNPRARKSTQPALMNRPPSGSGTFTMTPFITASVILPLLSKRKVTLYANGMLVSECPFALLAGVEKLARQRAACIEEVEFRGAPGGVDGDGKGARIGQDTRVGEREFRLDRGVSCSPRREQRHHGHANKGSQGEAPRESLHLSHLLQRPRLPANRAQRETPTSFGD